MLQILTLRSISLKRRWSTIKMKGTCYAEDTGLFNYHWVVFIFHLHYVLIYIVKIT